MPKKATDRTAIREIAAPFVEAKTAGELSEASARLRRRIRRGEVSTGEAEEAIALLSPGVPRDMAQHALLNPGAVEIPKNLDRIGVHRARIVESSRAPERVILRYILEVLVDILESKR